MRPLHCAAMVIGEAPGVAALALAAFAGAASFLSPCIAPLVPGYLAFVAGGEAQGARRMSRTAAFVGGFSLLFVLLGLGAASVTQQLDAHRASVELVGGIVVALFGLSMIAGKWLLPGSAAGVSGRLREPSGHVGAAAVGAAFAVAWSPCIGPVLGAILGVAGAGGDPVWGGTLLLLYALGLGVPFLLAAASVDRVGALSRRLRAHARVINIGAGVVMIAMGFLIAGGVMSQLTAYLTRIVPPLV